MRKADVVKVAWWTRKLVPGVFLIFAVFLLWAPLSFGATTITAPTGQQAFTQTAVASPVLDTDPSRAKPIGVGQVAQSGSTLSIQIGAYPFSQPVDFYFGIQLPNSPEIYLLTAGNGVMPVSQASSLSQLTWKPAFAGQLNEQLFGSLPTSALPSGTYYLYLLVLPTGSFSSYYIWVTSFTVSSSTPTSGWQRLGGPNGGIGYDIRYNFGDPNIWYVTDSGTGVLMSTDRGVTWKPSNTGFLPGNVVGNPNDKTTQIFSIFSLTVDPIDPQIVWAGMQGVGQIYKSTDGGKTWKEMDKGVDATGYDSLSIRGFTVDPYSSDIVYAMAELKKESVGGTGVFGLGIGGRVYKTTDGGLNWKIIWEGVPPSSLARYLWIDPKDKNNKDDDILYVSTGIFDRGAVGEKDPETNGDPFGGLGVLRSKDSGKTWEILGKSNGLEMLYIGSLYMDPLDPKVLLAAAGHLMMAPASDAIRQAGRAPGGIYRTADGGDHWTKVIASSGDFLSELFSAVEMCPPPYSKIAYAASDKSIHRSEDGGLTWTMVSGNGKSGWGPPGVVGNTPIDLQCDPIDPNRIFSNNYVGGNFLSEDGGRTWKNSSQGYSGAGIRNLAADPSDPARVYAAARSGKWGTDDGGTTWTGLMYPAAEYSSNFEYSSMAVDPAQTERILSGNSLIQESTDRGLTWHHLWPPLEGPDKMKEPSFSIGAVIDIVFAPSDAKKVYAALGDPDCPYRHEFCNAGKGVAYSSDSGKTWTLSADTDIKDLSVLDLDVAHSDANLVFAATEKGVFKTTDGGVSWSAVPVTGVSNGNRVRAVAISPKDPKRILAGVDGIQPNVRPVTPGVYLSTDGGATWQTAYSGLVPESSIHHIVFDPVDPNNVFLSDANSGVFRSTDGGKTWQQFITGLTILPVRPLVITADGQHLYLGTIGQGVFRYDLNGTSP